MSSFIDQKANSRFTRLRMWEMIGRILHMLTQDNQRLLSLEEVRRVVGSSGESYRGIRSVPLDRIIGSEGRYRDFNKHFLPGREHLRKRWTNIDKAKQTDIMLPVVQLYEIAGCYFVRDGNHRVSVARTIGAIDIDAEVTVLDTDIRLDPKVTRVTLKQSVIEYEKRRFNSRTNFETLVPDWDLRFTETGCYDETIRHIDGHKYFLNLDYSEEIPYDEALLSWFNNVFRPIVGIIREEKILRLFPKRAPDDLYLWIVRHWHRMKGKHGQRYSLHDAVGDFANQFGRARRKSMRRRA